MGGGLYAHFWWGEGGHHGWSPGLVQMEMDLLELGTRVTYERDWEECMGFWEPLAAAFDPQYPGYIGRP